MAASEMAVEAPEQLKDLVGRLESVRGFAEVVASLRAGHSATLDGVWGSSCALAAAALARHARGPLIVVCPHPGDIDELVDDLANFTAAEVDTFPAIESLAAPRAAVDEVFGERLRLLKRLATTAVAPPIVVTCIQALLQPVPARAELARHTRTLRVGEQCEPAELVRWLLAGGIHNTSAVELPGEVAARGGIVDLFALDWQQPVRVEWFGDEVASIRRFDVASQRSLESLTSIEVTLVGPEIPAREPFTSHVPAACWFLLVEPLELEEEGRQFLNRLDDPPDFFSVKQALAAVCRFPSVTAESLSAGSLETTGHLQVESVERFSGEVTRVREELDSAGAGQSVFVVCQTKAEVTRLEEVFAGTQLAAQGRLHFAVGRLRSGFRLVPQKIAVLSSAELFCREAIHRPSRRRWGRAIDSFLELDVGNYVVHVAHGIGRYLGLRHLEKEGHVEEHLELEFREGTKLYVPASKIELVQKYVGASKSRPHLSRIGGRRWTRLKQQAEEAVTDLAADMLDVQAQRACAPGISFPVDTEWQNEFDASFPYDETADQLNAIADIRADMHAPRPMDRLICGDVGYGKTELAMRAAFKAVEAGYQVAVLVPTTVLAEQHSRTFSSRMAEFPFEIGMLSRFVSRKAQAELLLRLEMGEIDLLIGTHRLVQPDVTFHNLGLVIIDEEQRFGVEVKERLKALRQTVDVMTLTATPIPRTLHMALLGLRDISNLETPPQDRLAVETRVTRFDGELVRHAVLRELNRGGQVFFVHNRIQDIDIVADRLARIVPEAKIRVGHGQMPEHQLERVMLDFVNRKFDVLLSTTIVESGLDIPNANTIFIDDADWYGLADLHQLRGRVGRYKHRAYCYLLVDPNKALAPAAAKRLRAIEEFSGMGAGFAISIRDLEIRGAGNLLGTQQSGHIAAVGYELYCQLLENAVRRLKKLPPRAIVDVTIDLPGEAFLPRSYVPGMRMKIDLYRRLARVSTEEELNDFSAEIVDRFGPPPPPAARLISLMQLRILAKQWQIEAIGREGSFAVLGFRALGPIETLARRGGGRLRIVDERTAYLPLEPPFTDPDSIHQQVKSLLRPT